MAEIVFAAELVDNVRLSLVSGVGPLLRKALLERFGTSAAVLATAKDDLQHVDGIGPKIAARIVAAKDEIDAELELQIAAEHGIEVLIEADAEYPRPLRQIHDPPGVLFRRGQALQQDELAVAIVGTRYGLAQAERLAASLARTGFTVVSGLARGIDAAAHRGALAAGGRTIAVLGSGLLEIYPSEHAKLADEVAANGYVISESPPRMVPLSGAFPQRNRIISGLTLGTIVVEAPDRSGSLITARHAYEQGREVFAVPGPVDSRMSRGCHALIRDGAKLVETIDDVLAAADLFVLPSHEEGMSLALLEALAAGLPAVACDIPGNRPLIAHGRQGWLVPPGQPPALAAGIEHALGHPAEARGWGAAARRRVAAEFSLAETVRRHRELFEEVLAQPRSPSR